MTTHINYKSDFCVATTLLDADGKNVTPPAWDWCLQFSCGSRNYVCSQKDGVQQSCSVKDDKIYCFLDNHKLGMGKLTVQFTQYIPDGNYSDGNRKTVVPKMLDVELWSDASDNCTAEVSGEINTELVYADMYKLAVQKGYAGTEQQYYELLSNPRYINEAESGYGNGILTLKIE